MPEQFVSEPQIYVSGEIKGKKFEIKAGQPFYSTATSYTYTVDSLRSFMFEISEADSAGTYIKRSVSISINNFSYAASKDKWYDLEHSLQPNSSYKYIFSPAFPVYYFKPLEVNFLYVENYGSTEVAYYSIPRYQNYPSRFIVKSLTTETHNGKNYKVAEIEFSCNLYCPDTNKDIYIENGRGRIAFSE